MPVEAERSASLLKPLLFACGFVGSIFDTSCNWWYTEAKFKPDRQGVKTTLTVLTHIIVEVNLMMQANGSLADFFTFSQSDDTTEFNPYDNCCHCHSAVPGYGDAAVILSGAELLDQHLRNLLLANLGGDPKEAEWLADRRIVRRSLAYCLDLIDRRQFKDLDYVSRIRNRVAHACPVPTFQRQDIGYLLREISGYQEAMIEGLDRRAFFMRTVYRLATELNKSLSLGNGVCI